MSTPGKPSYAYIERIATLMERASTQQTALNDLKKDLESFQSDQKQVNKSIKGLLEDIQSELTGRKEYLRGLKVGIAIFWLLMGAAVVTVLNKVFHIAIGLGG